MSTFEIMVKPADPFEPPAEVAFTETGRRYHHLGADRSRTYCGASTFYVANRSRINEADDPCRACFRSR